MANPLYLAMTAAEFSRCPIPSAPIAWMACHFSPYSQGLSNLPTALPPGSLVTVNDQYPPQGHDAGLIAAQLGELTEKLQLQGILLDFQRPGIQEIADMAEALIQALPCPVAVSHHYAIELDSPVFLPPPPLRTPPSSHFAPWQGREVWMEVFDQWESAVVTKENCTFQEEIHQDIPELPHFDEELHCHYGLSLHEDRAVFHLHRDLEDLMALPFPIHAFVGLYQDYGR